MRVALCALALLICGLRADAGMVRTLEGRTHYGEIRFEKDGTIVVAGREGAPGRYALGDLLTIDFRAVEPAGTLVIDSAQKRLADLRNWNRTDIGRADLQGETEFSGRKVTIRAAGQDIANGAHQDGFCFLHRPLNGDGEIIARITAYIAEGRPRAALMIRAGGDTESAYAMIGLSGSDVIFQRRGAAKEASQRPGSRGGLRVPLWLRLSRSGNKCRGYLSQDGSRWDLIGEAEVTLPPETLVGLAVASRQPENRTTVTFDSVSVTAGVSAISVGGGDEPFRTGILSRGGSLIAGDIQSVTETAVRFVPREQAACSLPRAEIARIQFRQLTPALLDNLQPGRAGALLANGDFIEGELLTLRDGRVRLSSIVFGLKDIDLWRDVAAIVLRDAGVPQAEYVLRLGNGSILQARSIAVKNDQLVIDEQAVGTMQIAVRQVNEIVAGNARFGSLLELRPARTEGDAVPMDSSVAGTDSRLLSGFHRALAVTAGTSVHYDLNGQYRSFVCRAAVPEAVLPVGRVKFVLKGDGRELHSGSPLTSLEEPATIAVDVRGVKRLTLRTEVEGPGVWALWGEPVLVRP